MTLCIARRLGPLNIELASDSRISVGENYFDKGIKVFELPISISMPPSGDDGELLPDDKGKLTFGLAVAGDTLHAYLVKDAVAELLKNLHYIPDHTDISIERICDLIKYYFTQLAQDIDGVRSKPLDTGFILTGYCLDQMRVRAFRFETKRSELNMIGGEYTEILKEKDDIEFIGSGAAIGREVHEKHRKWSILWILDEVIRSKRITSVGGRLQHGWFHDKFTFYINGVIDHVPDEDDNRMLTPRAFLRGVDIYNQEFTTGIRNYYISQDFTDAFNPARIEAWNNRNPDDQFIRVQV